MALAAGTTDIHAKTEGVKSNIIPVTVTVPVSLERLSVSQRNYSLLINDMRQLTAEYFNAQGVKQNVTILWQSSNSVIAEISSTGLLVANAKGQCDIIASYNSITSSPILITVMNDPTAVASVEITPPQNSTVQKGSSVQLNAIVKNLNGVAISGKTITWRSSNEMVFTISSTGLATALSDVGTANIIAEADQVQSPSIMLTTKAKIRMGTFVSAGGYHTSGTCSIGVVNGRSLLSLHSDFDTSFALGTYIYLANDTNGSKVRSSGFHVSLITTDGVQTFDVTGKVNIDDYKYVISLCYPASVTFGYAELK